MRWSFIYINNLKHLSCFYIWFSQVLNKACCSVAVPWHQRKTQLRATLLWMDWVSSFH
jgi:hypothetical protein